jgi:hypothetical protein
VASRRATLPAGLLLLALARPAPAQQGAVQQDSARAEIRAVLRAFYNHLENRNWEALGAYVLSPKLLERRGAPGELERVARERGRSRGSPQAAAVAGTCPSSTASMVEEAAIRLDGDWAEVSVRRCSGGSAGVDEFRMLYFERRWRFIYTDLFQAAPVTERAER